MSCAVKPKWALPTVCSTTACKITIPTAGFVTGNWLLRSSEVPSVYVTIPAGLDDVGFVAYMNNDQTVFAEIDANGDILLHQIVCGNLENLPPEHEGSLTLEVVSDPPSPSSTYIPMSCMNSPSVTEPQATCRIESGELIIEVTNSEASDYPMTLQTNNSPFSLSGNSAEGSTFDVIDGPGTYTFPVRGPTMYHRIVNSEGAIDAPVEDPDNPVNRPGPLPPLPCESPYVTFLYDPVTLNYYVTVPKLSPASFPVDVVFQTNEGEVSFLVFTEPGTKSLGLLFPDSVECFTISLENPCQNTIVSTPVGVCGDRPPWWGKCDISVVTEVPEFDVTVSATGLPPAYHHVPHSVEVVDDGPYLFGFPDAGYDSGHHGSFSTNRNWRIVYCSQVPAPEPFQGKSNYRVIFSQSLIESFSKPFPDGTMDLGAKEWWARDSKIACCLPFPDPRNPTQKLSEVAYLLDAILDMDSCPSDIAVGTPSGSVTWSFGRKSLA